VVVAATTTDGTMTEARVMTVETVRTSNYDDNDAMKQR
jgi:hypothetical protein